MLLIDYRQGSHELVAPLAALGLPVEEMTLEFGDVAFEGRGVKGAKVSIGIEFKKLTELVQSMRTGRLQGHQLPGMCSAYDHRWLLIEGVLRYDRQGVLLQRRYVRGSRKPELARIPGSMTVGEFLKRLHVMHLCAGLVPLWAADRDASLKQIEMLYRVWTDADLDQHKSHLGGYRAPSIVPLSTMRENLQTLPKVGQSVSLAAQKQFKSIRRAINAPAAEWAELALVDRHGHTKRLGMKDALAIEEAILHEHGN